MSGKEVTLRYNAFQDIILNHFTNLQHDSNFTDVTLACKEGYKIKAHKVILSAASVFFRELLEEHVHVHPLFCLLDVEIDDLRKIIKYCYTGEVRVPTERLNTIQNIANALKIEGLQKENITRDESSQKDDSLKTYKSIKKIKSTKRGKIVKKIIPDSNIYLDNDDPLTIQKMSKLCSFEVGHNSKTEILNDREAVELEPQDGMITNPNINISKTGFIKDNSETLTSVKIEENIEDNKMQSLGMTDKKYIISKKNTVKDLICKCGFQTLRKYRWINHTKICPPPKWPCNLCDIEMKKEAHLKKHMWLEHIKDRCGEEGCNYTSPFASELTLHIKKEHGEKLICDICGDEYASDLGLKKHIDRIHDGRRLACTICQYQALTKNHLNNHKKTKHREQDQLMKRAMIAG